MSLTSVIRRAAPGDLEGLAAVENSCFTDEAFSRRQLRYLLNRASGAIFVALLEKRIVGYVSLLLSARHGQGRIYSLAIEPQSRGLGLAGSLLDTALGYARERGADAVFLEVELGNAAALALYRKKGFVERGIKPGYYHSGADALSMVRRPA